MASWKSQNNQNFKYQIQTTDTCQTLNQFHRFDGALNGFRKEYAKNQNIQMLTIVKTVYHGEPSYHWHNVTELFIQFVS